jgi:hypothetical protein
MKLSKPPPVNFSRAHMSLLTTSYSIAYASGVYTINWASTYSAVSFVSDTLYVQGVNNSTVYFVLGQSGNYTTLDWTYCTGVGATTVFANRAAVISAITALNDSAISGSPVYTDQNASQCLALDSSKALTTIPWVIGGPSGLGSSLLRRDSLGAATASTFGATSSTLVAIGNPVYILTSSFGTATGGFSNGWRLKTVMQGSTGVWDITLPPNSGTVSLTDLAETFSAVKTFSAVPNFTAATNQLSFQPSGSGNKLIVNAPSPTGADRTLSYPTLTANDTLMSLGLAQTVTGAKTFTAFTAISNQLSLATDSNQLRVGGGSNIYNFSIAAPAASRQLTWADPGAGAWFPLCLTQALTISGTPTTGQVVTATSSTAASWQSPTSASTVSITFTFNISNTKTVVCPYLVIGKLFILTIPYFNDFACDASVRMQSSGSPLSGFAPATNFAQIVNVITNGTSASQASGVFDVTTGGAITVFTSVGVGNFTSGNNVGLGHQQFNTSTTTVMYILA